MKRVGAALANYVDLTTGGAAEAGIIVGDTYAKLVGAFDSDGNDWDLVTASGDHVIGDVDAVEIEGVLVAPSASDSATGVAEAAAIGSFVGRRPGLECEQFARIALQSWQVHES